MQDESNQSIGTADNRLQRALRGESLFGDDFSLDEITEWFEDEREGYFNLQHEAQEAEPEEPTMYAYDALAQIHGFNWLSVTEVDCVLGIGSATGAELAPLAKLSKSLTVLEPSDGFKTDTVHGKPVSYIKPNASGLMPFKDSAFDIVVCFSVFRHIATI